MNVYASSSSNILEMDPALLKPAGAAYYLFYSTSYVNSKNASI